MSRNKFLFNQSLLSPQFKENSQNIFCTNGHLPGVQPASFEGRVGKVPISRAQFELIIMSLFAKSKNDCPVGQRVYCQKFSLEENLAVHKNCEMFAFSWN